MTDPVDVMARTLWGEARGERRAGMEAVAAVIMNRVRHPRRWPHTVPGVAHQAWQFSAWNKNDPNRRKLLAVTERDAQFRTALEVAREAVSGRLKDPTGGADHYHARHVRPRWANQNKITARIGQHIFYRLA